MKCSVDSGVRVEPGLDDRVLVGAVVVADQVDRRGRRGPRSSILVRNFLNSIARWRRCRLEITVPSATFIAANKRGGAVTDVVMGARSGMPGIIGNAGWERCRAWTWDFSSTHSTTAASGGFRYRPDDVVELVDEQRVGGELEVIDQVRLEAEVLPDLPDRGLRQPGPLGHLRPGPVRRVRRRRLQSRHDDVLDLVHADRAWPPGRGSSSQPIEAVLDEPAPPLADGVLRAAAAARRRPCCPGPRRTPSTILDRSANACDDVADAPPRQLLTLVGSQNQFSLWDVPNEPYPSLKLTKRISRARH